jgi:TolB-like protein/tetratricopeptide (TPR) repeat protein
MADVFLSYSREDRAAVQPLAEALVGAGYSVWWDRSLVGGARYLEETEAELKAAKVVLVVWTKTSIKSHWVADEAGAGRDSQRLVPISLDGSEPPLGFRQYQVIDFTGWRTGDELGFADLLQALARHIPPSGEAAPRPPVKQPARGGGFPSWQWVFGGAALAGVALVATVAFSMMRPQGASPAGPPASQRIAFFGFTANSSDPVSAEVASVATDETFKTLNQIGLDTVSRDETQIVKLGGQLARARELGALYALGGQVRNEGGKFRVSIRMDDAVNGTTIWDVTLTGSEADKVSLPFQATAGATGMVDCFIGLRTSLKREDEKTLKLVSRYCDAARRGDRLEHAERARELAASARDSARVQSTFATYLHEALLLAAPPSDRPALRKEIDGALKLALDADPNDTMARTLGAMLAVEDGKPFADSESVLFEILQQNPNDYAANNWYGVLLRTVGRSDDAVRHFRTADRLRPLDTTLRANLAGALVITGQALEGQKLFEETNARLPTPWMWEAWMGMATSHKLTDLEEVLASAPPTVSGDRLACWRDIAQATASRTAKLRQAGAERARACNVRGLHMLAALGDIDAAFEQAGIVGHLNSGWWVPSSRPLRADPRFLPLMKNKGQYQYWLDTGTHPDVCDLSEEKNYELCAGLRADQTAR